jgi:hypothetical protein
MSWYKNKSNFIFSVSYMYKEFKEETQIFTQDEKILLYYVSTYIINIEYYLCFLSLCILHDMT